MGGIGRGKRGGARVIYYYSTPRDQIWLLMLYTKARKRDLTQNEKRLLMTIVERWIYG